MNQGESSVRYKFLRLKDGSIKSEYGNMTWEPGEWAKVPGKLAVCGQGLHCSTRMFDAFTYVKGEIVAKVEVAGKSEAQNDKEAWQELRLIDVRLWRKEDSVALSIYAAELVLVNFEKAMPGNDRPRKAIEAAKAWLVNPTPQNEDAAHSAHSAAYSAHSAAYSAHSARSARSAAYAAAYAAYAARSAAYAAAYAAYAAYSAAHSAAYAAADAARSAADSADSAARSAAHSAAYAAADSARSAIIDQVNTWMENRFESLPRYRAKMVTPGHITALEANQVIVVGTNTAGMHGGGLARQAEENFGLEPGVGEGLNGKTCYAYPTLNGDLEKRTDAQMKRSTSQFYATVKALPEKQFLLTKVGTGIAGYDEDYMKALFSEDVDNLVKPEGW